MLELGGADREGERAETADGAGMAVGHGMGRARQHHAELGRDHVGDALLGIAEIEDADAVAPAALAHRAQERRAFGIRGVVAAGLGRDGVVLHREGQVGPPHRPVRLGEFLEGMGAVQLVEHVPIDIDEIAAVGAARHEMGIPDLVEQSLRHGGVRRCGASEVLHRKRTESNAPPPRATRTYAFHRTDGVGYPANNDGRENRHQGGSDG